MTVEMPSIARTFARHILASPNASEADREDARRVLAQPARLCPPCAHCLFSAAENARIDARARAAHDDKLAARVNARALYGIDYFSQSRFDGREAAHAAYAASEAETYAIIRERLDIEP